MKPVIELIEVEEKMIPEQTFRVIKFWYTKKTKIGVTVWKRDNGTYDLSEYATIPLPEGSDRLFNDDKKLTAKQRQDILNDILNYSNNLTEVE